MAAAIAPMDLVRVVPRINPLKCIICPTSPGFSDISHLLTHVASKGHLHHVFQAGIVSKTKAEVARALEEYNEWYRVNNIDNLLAERIATKEKKTKKRSRAAETVSKRKEAELKRLTRSKPQVNSRPTRPVYHIKPEPVEEEEEEEMPVTRQMQRRLHAHPEPRNVATNVHRGYAVNSRGGSTSGTRRVRRRNSYKSSKRESSFSDEIDLPTPSSNIISPTMEHADDSELGTAKLKGVVYPGMGLFDAASEVQRRKRNQRKDDSVLQHMKTVSAGISPTECIWEENFGDFQRSRDIYATPSIEGTPDRDIGDLEEDESREETGQKQKRRASAATTRSRQISRPTRSSARLASHQLEVRSALEMDDDDEPDEEFDLKMSMDMSMDSREAMPNDSSSHLLADHTETFHGFHADSPMSYESIPMYTYDARRPALSTMNANYGMVSPSSRPQKTNSRAFFPSRGQDFYPGFAGQQPMSSFAPQQSVLSFAPQQSSNFAIQQSASSHDFPYTASQRHQQGSQYCGEPARHNHQGHHQPSDYEGGLGFNPLYIATPALRAAYGFDAQRRNFQLNSARRRTPGFQPINPQTARTSAMTSMYGLAENHNAYGDTDAPHMPQARKGDRKDRV